MRFEKLENPYDNFRSKIELIFDFEDFDNLLEADLFDRDILEAYSCGCGLFEGACYNRDH